MISHLSKLVIWGSSWGRGFRFHYLHLDPDRARPRPWLTRLYYIYIYIYIYRHSIYTIYIYIYIYTTAIHTIVYRRPGHGRFPLLAAIWTTRGTSTKPTVEATCVQSRRSTFTCQLVGISKTVGNMIRRCPAVAYPAVVEIFSSMNTYIYIYMYIHMNQYIYIYIYIYIISPPLIITPPLPHL